MNTRARSTSASARSFCRVLDKYLIYADALEIGITPHLALDGYWESWITLALARTARPG